MDENFRNKRNLLNLILVVLLQMKIGRNQSSLLVTALVILASVSALIAVVYIFSEIPSHLVMAQPQISSANATGMSSSPVIESKGMITGQRVLEVHPLPKIETSFIENDSFNGGNIIASEMGTYSSVLRPDGSLYGEGQGIITTKDGEVATWTGQGIGHFMPDGRIVYHGSLFFNTPYSSTSSKLAFLNNMVGIFNYEIDQGGKTTSRVWEWK